METSETVIPKTTAIQKRSLRKSVSTYKIQLISSSPTEIFSKVTASFTKKRYINEGRIANGIKINFIIALRRLFARDFWAFQLKK